MKLRRTMKAQSLKKKEKERYNNNNKEKKRRIPIRPEDMQRGSWSDQRTCSKKNQHQGPIYVQIFSKKAIKNLSKSSERTRSGYPEAARGSGSSERAVQLKWD